MFYPLSPSLSLSRKERNYKSHREQLYYVIVVTSSNITRYREERSYPYVDFDWNVTRLHAFINSTHGAERPSAAGARYAG